MKRTKIVCTIGPASETKTKIEQLIHAGLNVARLNFSHGKYEHHALLIKNIRTVSAKLGVPVAILQDLQGPRIRIGDVSKDGVKVQAGQSITLVPEHYRIALKDIATFIPIQYPNLYKDVKPGHVILIDDGTIQLEVESIKAKAIRCKVQIAGTIFSHKGMNFPKSRITCPPVTEKDMADLKFGLEQNVDFVALSFVKDAGDILRLRRSIAKIEKRLGHKLKDFRKPKRTPGDWTFTKIIAKIERPEAVKNFEAILSASDGIMVARGDLGLEMPLEDLPLIQKKIVRRCVQEAKPVIVATQMLDSMIRQPVPTRAEVSDVANAILDGTDAIMLSGETASGKYPLQAVRVMHRIATEVESKEMKDHQTIEAEFKNTSGISESVSYVAQDLAEQLHAKLVVCTTTSGFTARAISKYRSKVPVVALAALEKSRNQLCLSWGVEPYYVPFIPTFAQLLTKIRKIVSQKQHLRKGNVVVIAASHPFNYLGQTNSLKVETL